MNNKKTAFILILVMLTTISCSLERDNNEKPWNLVMKDGLLYNDTLSSKPFTGHYKGKVMGKRIEYDVVDGKQTGLFVLYHENGNVATLGYMKENKNHGDWKYYYPNGVLESEGKFNEDKPDSTWIWFYMTGAQMQEGRFDGGKKEGSWKYYDESGNLYLLMNYENDQVKDSIKYELPAMSVE